MALKQKLGAANRWFTSELFVFTCWLISVLLPASRWYPTVLALSRLLARTAGWLAPFSQGASRASLVPRLLHRFLDLLSTHQTYFPIPMVIVGEEHLRDYIAQPGGFVCCSAHIPFIKLFLPLIRQLVDGGRELRIIAREPVGNNEVLAWNGEPWKAIRTDHAVLLHTRTLLRQKGCLILVIDKEQGEFISSNIFRFVGKMNSRILMCFTQLQPDGRILMRIMLPPGPLCRSEEEIHANLDFVAQNVRLILQGDKIESASHVEAAPAYAATVERSREVHRIQLYSNLQLETRMRRLEALLAEQNGSLMQRTMLEERLALMKSELEIRTGI